MRLKSVLYNSAVAVFAAIVLLPVIAMFIGSFQHIYLFRLSFSKLTFENYMFFIKNPNVLYYLGNSAFVVGIGVALTTAVTVVTAYALRDSRQTGRSHWFYTVLLLGMAIPRQVLYLPLYVLINRAGFGELWAAILPSVFVPTGVIMAKAAIDYVPQSIIDQARLDTKAEWQAVWYIVFPIIKPLMLFIAVGTTTYYFTDVIWQNLVCQTRPTLLIGMYRMMITANYAGAGNMITDIGKQFAASVIIFMPVFIVFVFGNKYMLKDFKIKF